MTYNGSAFFDYHPIAHIKCMCVNTFQNHSLEDWTLLIIWTTYHSTSSHIETDGKKLLSIDIRQCFEKG